jgi:hypothetical protein
MSFGIGFGALSYTISPSTNWVVACGRNIATAGAAGSIVNGVVTKTAPGGLGSCSMSLNYDNLGAGGASPQMSDFEFSKLYVWDKHLTNVDFADASAKLNQYLGQNSCMQCPAGSYSDSTGATACTKCPAGTYSITVGASSSVVCTVCTTGTYSITVGANSSMACTACMAGSYSGNTGASGCSTCLPGLSSLAGASICRTSELICIACPANTSFTGGVCTACAGDTVSAAGSAACQCKTGFTGAPGACQACPAGTYKRMAGTSACRACQANSVSQSGSALCACGPGYTGITGDVCVACVAGKYKSVIGSAACIDCAGRRNSPAAAPNITSCLCDAAYTQLENAAWTYEAVYDRECVACAAGTFKALAGVQACTVCAQNQSSVTAMTVCSCVPGFTGPDGGPCAECARGTYKDWLGSQACTTCPANAQTDRIGSTLLSHCTCNNGHTGPDGGPCVACAAGKYKNVIGSSLCVDCPSNTYSTLTSAAVSCTTCLVGFQSISGSSVVADCCDPNTTIVRSPFFSLSDAMQAQLSPQYVVRISGSPMVGSTATPDSVRPTYIATDGFNGQPFLRFSKTTPTTGNQYLAVSGGYMDPGSGLTIVTVVRFIENIEGVLLSMQKTNEFLAFEVRRSAGLQFCVCRLVGGNECNNLCTDAAVPTNVWLQASYTYNPSATNKELITVSYTLSGSTVTLTKTSTSGIGGFAPRKSGFGYSASGCSGNQAWISPGGCANRANFELAGFYFMQTLASNADVTVLFQAIASGAQIAFDRSTTCPCNAGFGGTGRSNCASCAPGSYKSQTMSAACSLCPVDMYSFAVQALDIGSCVPCPQGTVSMQGESTCFCAAGSTGPNFGPCVLCEPGKFKNWRDSSVCPMCPANSNSVAGTTLCPCNVGYTGPLGGPCVACVPGKYKDSNGTAACTTCPAQSYEPDVAATLVTNCTCNTGYDGADGGPCIACALGKYKATNGSTSCGDCAVHTYSDTLARAACSACPRFTVSLSGSPSIWDCQCTLGYTGPGGRGYFINNLARACGLTSNDACLSAGFSMLAAGNAGMSSAVDLSFSPGGVWSFVVGGTGAFAGINFGVQRDVTTVFVYQGAENLKLYVGNSYNPYTSNALCSGGWTWISPWREYTCGKRGQYLYFEQPNTAVNLELIEILVSGYRVGDPCTACGSGRHKASIGSIDCTECGANTYSEVVNATSVATCLECQGNSTSILGSPSKMFCQCNVGFLHVGEGCEMCAPGTYNDKLGRTACSKCSTGLYSVNYQAAANETCLSCPAGEWSPEGSVDCEECPPSSAALPGMGRIVDCACDVGYTGPGGGPCVKCEVGKYKDTTGSWACSMCPAYTSSPLGSVKVGDCFCIVGFSGPNGLPCTACELGKYKAVPGASACQLCPANTYSDSVGFSACTACVSTSASANGSTSIWNCTCNAGYTGPTYLSVKGNANFARSCGDGSQACPTAQSSTFAGYTAGMAVDGETATNSNTMFASNQWWRVDFGRRVTITGVLIFFSQHTTDTLVLHVGDDQAAGGNSICASMNFYGTADAWKTVDCLAARTGQFLHVRNTVGSNLGLREIQAVGSEVVTLVWPGYCEACRGGFFKPATGNQVCSLCAANTFSNATAALSVQTCVACAPNAVSASASVVCACNIGFTGVPGACTACAFGKFKNEVGAAECAVCPVHSVGWGNSSNGCLCEVGYEASW